MADELAPDPRFDDVEPKPAAAGFRPPVPWLLAPELLGTIKRIVMHALYKGDFDARDWMSAACADTDEAARAGDADQVWFDYVSDIGDGQTAMYATAFLCQDDLYLDPAGAVTTPSAVGAAPPGSMTLPRGQFLFVGGDTAYHVADVATLNTQVRKPFVWAHRDIAQARMRHGLSPRRDVARLYAIPGNHDYYDQLVGFNRMFRRPAPGEDGAGPARKQPLLPLPGYERAQDTSYVAIRLPWGWQLWGLDAGTRHLDYRQRRYFLEQVDARRLIVATPAPAVALGRVVAGGEHRDALAKLGLSLPRPAAGARPAPVEAPLEHRGADGDVRRLECRLDLSGDVHHYARHGGGSADGGGAQYANVHAGAGAAFHQPSFADFGQIRRDAVYPSPTVSRRAIASQLLDPLTIVRGGFVRALGFLFALIVLDASLHGNTSWLFDALLSLVGIERERPLGALTAPVAIGHRIPRELGASLGFFCLLVAAALCWVLAARLARWVLINSRRSSPSRAFRRYLRGPLSFDPYMPAWALVCAGLVVPLISPYLIDDFPDADVLFRDVTFLAATLLVARGLIGLAVSGGCDHERPGRIGFAALGVVHTVLQLFVPFLLVRVALDEPLSLSMIVAVWGLTTVIGWRLFVDGRRWLLLLVWLARGAAVIGVALYAGDGIAIAPSGGARDALLYAASGVAGMVVACLEFGWYLSVTAGFGGHVAEAGAAARIEGYKHMIRFRLTADRLTGYVIAIDEPRSEGVELKARVIDEFWIEPRG